MLVATPDGDEEAENIRRQLSLDSQSGGDALLILPVRVGQDDVADVARELHTRQFLWPVKLDAFPGPPVRVTPDAEAYLLDDRLADTRRLQAQEQDYTPPVFALQAIEAARHELPGRGYLHVTAPGMWGKSFLVSALRHGWKPDAVSAALGRTIGYAILHGRPENPGDFLHDVYEEAKTLGGGRPLRKLPPPHEQRTIDDMRRVLCEVLKQAKEQKCAPDQPLLLAVDALDELTDGGTDTNRSLILDYLPRADELPDGCYVLLTSRSDLRPRVWHSLAGRIGVLPPDNSTLRPGGGQAHFAPQTPQSEPVPDGFYRRVEFDITDEYRQLLRDFLLASLPASIGPQIETILTRGKNSFLYVRLLRDLLGLQIAERGESVLLNLQPGDLLAGDEVFPAYLDQLAQDVSSRQVDPKLFAQWHRPILLLIAAAYEPATRDHLRRWLGSQDWDDRASHYLNLALDDLSPLLNTERSSAEGHFTVAHREFLDWLANNNHPRWSNGLRDEGHGRITRSAEQVPLPLAATAMTPTDLYQLLHLPSHWLAQGNGDAAWHCLSNSDALGLLDDVTVSFYDRWLWTRQVCVLDCRVEQLTSW